MTPDQRSAWRMGWGSGFLVGVALGLMLMAWREADHRNQLDRLFAHPAKATIYRGV